MKKTISVVIFLVFIVTIFAWSAFSASADTIQPTYNNVPTNLQYITSVKSQGNYGNCWAFSAIACCEAEAVKNHGANRLTIDLSELHLAYFSYNGERSTGDTITSYSPFYQHGGFSQLPIFTFSNWIGLVDESVAKYSDFTKNPSLTLNKDLMYANVKYRLTNAYTYSLPDDIQKVKQAIMQYGAVQTAYYSNEAYLKYTDSSNNKVYAQYCPTAYTSDHAVTIVGWDDGYSREHFKEGIQPQKDGAWLVKNSWGKDWGLSGYFWLSYEDKTAISATAFDVTPVDELLYDNNYQHDGGLSLTYSEYSKTSAANIFTANDNEELMAVSVTTYDTVNSDYTLKIYLNPDELSPSKFNKGTPVHEQSGKIAEAGFTTIPLTSSVTLNKGDVFIILIETNAHLALDSDQNLTEGSKVLVKSDASVLPNQTYLSVDGSAFYDASTTQNGANPFNARIKAFTKNLTLGTLVFKSLPAITSIEYGQALKNSNIVGGEVTDSLSGKTVRGEWSFKHPDSIVENGTKVKIVFTPENPEYETFEKEITVNVTASAPKLTVKTDKNSYKGGDKVTVSAIVQNKHSTTLSDLPDVRFYYQINNGEKIYFSGSFTLPKDISGKKITIAAINDEVEGKYTQITNSISFSTDAQSDNNNNNNTTDNSNGTTTSPGGNSNGSGNINGNGNGMGNGNEDENLQGSESMQGTSTSQNPSQITPEQDKAEEGIGKDFESAINGCFSSASLSAIITVSAIFGFASIKKKKYDK